MKNISRLVALGFGVSLLTLSASAQWGPEEEKNCLTKDKGGSLTLSAQGGSGFEDSSKLQQYETFPKGVFVPCADFAWTNDKNYFLNVRGTKLGLDDQFASLVGGKKGGFKLKLGWDQNPNWQSNTAQTPFSETRSGSTAFFHVPDGMRLALQNVYTPWVTPTSSNPAGVGSAPANPTVAGFYAVEPWVTGAPPIDLRYERKTGRVGFELPVGESLVFNASYAHETRDGNKNTTLYGGPSYEVATPIDYTTDNFRFGGEYAKGRFFANAAADFSSFTNDVQYAEIDNPERLQLNNPGFPTARTVYNDAAAFRLWLPPDNNAYTVDLTGGVTFPRRHKITASLSTGQMKMDHELLNISTNPDLGLQPPNPAFTIVPPYGSVQAKMDTFMGQVKLTGDPWSKLGYILSWRKFELTDKTDEYHFTSTVRGDVLPSYSTEGFTREPEGWGSESLRAEVHFLPVTGLRLGAQLAREKRNYDIRSYADVKDNVFTLSGDYAHDWLTFHVGWTNFDRSPGDANSAAIPPSWAGATQTDISERHRHIWSGLVTLTPSGPFTVALTGQKQTNDFAESVTGLLDQSFDTVGVDVTYAASKNVSAFAGYVYEKYFFSMAAAYIPRGQSPPFDPANQWGNDTTDKVDTFRAGLTWVLVPEKLDLDATFDYTKPRSESIYDFALPGTPIGGLNEANGIFPSNVPPIPGFPVTTFDRFPLVSKKFIMAKIRLAYHVGKNLTASAMYWKQKYDNTDWQTDLMQPYMGRVDPGSNRWFFLGARIPSYDANVFRASVTYNF